MSAITPTPPPPSELENSQAPPTQADRKLNVVEWIQFLPRRRFIPEEPDVTVPLIEPEVIDCYLKPLEDSADPEDQATAKQIRDDIALMNHDLLRLFRQRDHEAKKQQNDYRLYQIGFLLLAAAAAVFGSLQALALSGNARVALAIFAFGETLVALTAVYLATISGREPPLPRWLDARRKAEQLRREYFRFLLNLAPYDKLPPIERKLRLSERAADINRGSYPSESGVI
jgi:hypothetical protein